MMTESVVRQALKEWIAQKSGALRPDEIGDDLPIIERRVIRSVQIADLILRIEELSGKRIEAEQIKPGVFRDIDTIYRNFFAPAPSRG